MKVLHYSDREEKNLPRLFEECDFLITTGDLTILDFRSIENSIKTKPAFGVYGNHCNPGYLEDLGINNVHLKVVNFGNIKIGGYQGSLRYKLGGGPQFTEEEAKIDLENYPAVDILLLHSPPSGLLDEPQDPVHKGSRFAREYVDRTRPKYIFCGHISPSTEALYQGIRLYRTHKARLIEINLPQTFE